MNQPLTLTLEITADTNLAEVARVLADVSRNVAAQPFASHLLAGKALDIHDEDGRTVLGTLTVTRKDTRK